MVDNLNSLKPQAAVDSTVEGINAVISETVRACGGTDRGAYYKEVARIILIFDAYVNTKESP